MQNILTEAVGSKFIDIIHSVSSSGIIHRHKKMWFECQSDSAPSKSQFIKVNCYKFMVICPSTQISIGLNSNIA